MAESKDLILGGLALVGGVSLGKAAIAHGAALTINNISHSVGKPKVSLANIATGKVDITVPVYVLNSNSFSITIDKFLGNVAYGAIPLGVVEIPDQFTLVSGENIALDLFFSVDISNTIAGVFNSVMNGGFSAILDKIYLKGDLYILGGTFFGQVKIPIETTIPIV